MAHFATALCVRQGDTLAEFTPNGPQKHLFLGVMMGDKYSTIFLYDRLMQEFVEVWGQDSTGSIIHEQIEYQKVFSSNGPKPRHFYLWKHGDEDDMKSARFATKKKLIGKSDQVDDSFVVHGILL